MAVCFNVFQSFEKGMKERLQFYFHIFDVTFGFFFFVECECLYCGRDAGLANLSTFNVGVSGEPVSCVLRDPNKFTASGDYCRVYIL